VNHFPAKYVRCRQICHRRALNELSFYFWPGITSLKGCAVPLHASRHGFEMNPFDRQVKMIRILGFGVGQMKKNNLEEGNVPTRFSRARQISASDISHDSETLRQFPADLALVLFSLFSHLLISVAS
jgi:hypothetical protein